MNRYIMIAIIVGVFIVGVGSGYAVIQSSLSSSGTISQQQMQQMILDDPQKMQEIHVAMMNNKQHMKQMMSHMMDTMMNDPQMRQQMMNNMIQHQAMMSSMMQNKPMMDMMMSGNNTNMMMGNSMMENKQMMNMMENSIPMTKQQNRNQVGMLVQDPELKQQMRELVFQNINSIEQSNEILASGQSSDNSVFVEIKSSTPLPGKFLEITETFHDKDGSILEHVNHGIHVTQDDQTVLKMSDLHSHHGEITYYTRELHSDSPVEVEILMNGIGMEKPLTGPINEIIIVEVS